MSKTPKKQPFIRQAIELHIPKEAKRSNKPQPHLNEPIELDRNRNWSLSAEKMDVGNTQSFICSRAKTVKKGEFETTSTSVTVPALQSKKVINPIVIYPRQKMWVEKSGKHRLVSKTPKKQPFLRKAIELHIPKEEKRSNKPHSHLNEPIALDRNRYWSLSFKMKVASCQQSNKEAPSIKRQIIYHDNSKVPFKKTKIKMLQKFLNFFFIRKFKRNTKVPRYSPPCSREWRRETYLLYRFLLILVSNNHW